MRVQVTGLVESAWELSGEVPVSENRITLSQKQKDRAGVLEGARSRNFDSMTLPYAGLCSPNGVAGLHVCFDFHLGQSPFFFGRSRRTYLLRQSPYHFRTKGDR